jgi:methylmalonyl-CoA/ethylmalonyl-CoA epimerase
MIATLEASAPAAEPPVTGVAGARFHASDLARARAFYGEVVGLKEKPATDPAIVAFAINGEQWLEFSSAPATRPADPLERIVFATSDPRGTTLVDPDGHTVEIVPSAAGAAAPGSTSDAHSLSDHMLHVGLGTTDLARAQAFYAAHFGCKEIWRGPAPDAIRIVILRAPGPRDDWVEFLLPGPQGSPDHLCLEVPDIQRAYQALLDRGATLRGKPRIASNGHRVLNLADPNGIRVELMEPRPAAK